MSVAEAERSFLSFARAAMRTETAHKYENPSAPIARQDAVYRFLRERLYAPPGLEFPELSPIWHLLSWVVVALEAHLTATSTTDATCEPTWLAGGPLPVRSEIEREARYGDRASVPVRDSEGGGASGVRPQAQAGAVVPNLAPVGVCASCDKRRAALKVSLRRYRAKT